MILPSIALFHGIGTGLWYNSIADQSLFDHTGKNYPMGGIGGFNLPFSPALLLYGGLLPAFSKGKHGDETHAVIDNSWTVLCIRDYTGGATVDNSPATFIFNSVLTANQAKIQVRELFPKIWERMNTKPGITPIVELATFTEAYFFGVLEPNRLGHFLYNHKGNNAERDIHKKFPFDYRKLDGGFCLSDNDQKQAEWNHTIVAGWTILSTWDRTGDSRGGSNSSFVFNSEMSMSETLYHSQLTFPKLWKRITEATK